ncbi:MAG: DegT/DnrJ/EryC1/StrS family aminotransferase [Candidatus Bathyarchaeota archaeon]
MDVLASKGGKAASPKRISIAKPIISPGVLGEIKDVLESGQLRQGRRVREFEALFAEKVGARHAYAVCNGTAALHVAYLSAVRPGDEVLVPSFTFLATASMVYYSMARPVFADIDPETYLIDLEDVKEKITPRTRAVVPVHLFGNAADIRGLQDLCEDHGLTLIHDSAQAHGTRYDGRDVGGIGDLGCYSFYPSKTLTTGEGGMVTTDDEGLYRRGVLLRAHGDDGRYHHIMMGFNYRLTELAAVLGLDQMRQFDGFLKRRRRCGEYLRREIGRVEGLHPQKVTPKVDHSYSYFSLTMDPDRFRCTRDQFLEALTAENIECAVHYPAPLTEQPAVKELLDPAPCPVSEAVSERIFSLPMHPALTDEDLERIVAGVEKVAGYYLK